MLKSFQLQVYTDAGSSTGNPEKSKLRSYRAMDLIDISEGQE